MKAIEQTLDGLKKSAESGRFGRKEWKALLYGQVLDLAFTYVIPPHVAKTIILGAMHCLDHLFGIGGMPPSLPVA